MTTEKTTRQNRVREALGRIYDQQPPYFREYLRRFQEDPTSRVFAPLAEAYRRLGRVDEAIEICREGLEHHPDFHGGRVAYAKCLVDKKQFADAKRELERVVYAVPENLLAQRLLGEVNAVVGDREASLHAFKMALLLSPADVGLAEKVHQLERHVAQPAAKTTPAPKPAAVRVAAPPPEAPVTEIFFEPPTSAYDPALSTSMAEQEEVPAAPRIREDFVERNLQVTEDPLGASNSLEALLNETDEEIGDDLAPLWQMDEAPPAAPVAAPPKGTGHDDIFVSEPLDAAGEGLDAHDGEGIAPLQAFGSADPVVDEGLEALLGREESAGEEAFKVEHVSEIFQEQADKSAPQEITTETLGDLYFSQGQFDRALRIFEKIGERGVSAELARKIRGCQERLGVTREQMVRNRQIEALRKMLSKAHGRAGVGGGHRGA